MLRYAFIALLLISAPALAAGKQWYEGGTLQKATVAEWQRAAPENRLATAGDFIASISGISDIGAIHDAAKLADIRKQADDLILCVNDAAQQKDVAADQPVAQIVVSCTVLKTH